MRMNQAEKKKKDNRYIVYVHTKPFYIPSYVSPQNNVSVIMTYICTVLQSDMHAATL